MKLKKRGYGTSAVEVLNISPLGVWIMVHKKEYFLPYEGFPWFKNATVSEIHGVSLLHERHLHWKDLDVDLELKSLEHLEQYPLIWR